MVNPLILLPIIVGPILILTGLLLKKFPPRKMNILYGYRTASSMKNQEQWDFAQRCAAVESMRLGVILTLCVIPLYYYNPADEIMLIVGLGLMLITFILLIVRVELAIKNRFNIKEK